MNASKQTTAVLFCLLTIVGSAGLAFEAHRYWTSQLALASRESAADWGYGSLIFGSNLALLSCALLVGLFYLLPVMRRQTEEQGKLHSLTSVLSRRSQDFEFASLTDPLTGMNNRRYFDEALVHYIAEFRRIERPLGLMILDLDFFKSVNDTHGHDMGDEVLRRVAQCLLDFTRYHDVLARTGGEEFAIIAPNMSAADLESFANRIRLAVEGLAIPLEAGTLRITVSIGVAVADEQEKPRALFKRADVNLYRAKKAGRNRVCA